MSNSIYEAAEKTVHFHSLRHNADKINQKRTIPLPQQCYHGWYICQNYLEDAVFDPCLMLPKSEQNLVATSTQERDGVYAQCTYLRWEEGEVYVNSTPGHHVELT